MKRACTFFVILGSAAIALVILTGCGSKSIKKAEDYLSAGMFQQAADLLQLEIQDNPKNAKAHYLLGVALLSMKSDSAAKEEFQRATLLDAGYRTKVGEAYFMAATALLEQNEYSAARLFEEAVKYDPDSKTRIPKSVLDRAQEIADEKAEWSEVQERVPGRVGVFWDSGKDFVEIPVFTLERRVYYDVRRRSIMVTNNQPKIAIYMVKIDPSDLVLGSVEIESYPNWHRFMSVPIDVVPSGTSQGLYWIKPRETLSEGLHCITHRTGIVGSGAISGGADIWPFTISTSERKTVVEEPLKER